MRPGLLVLSLCLIAPLTAAAQRTCVEDVLCVYTRQGNNEVTFFVESEYEHPVRLFLIIHSVNMRSDKELPYSAIYEPGTTTQAVTLTQYRQDEGVSWKYRFIWRPAPLSAGDDAPSVRSSDLTCDQDRMCILTERIDERVLFRAINLTDYTMSVEFKPGQFENLRADIALPVTKVVPPQDSVLMVQTYISNPTQRYRYTFNYPYREGAAGQRHSLEAGYLVPHTIPDRPVRKRDSPQADERHNVYWYVPDGATVRVAREGRVLEILEGTQDGEPAYSVKIQHDDGSQAVYSYFDQVAVAEDSLVTAGTLLGHAPRFVMMTVRILRSDMTYVSIPIRFYQKDGSLRALRNGEVY